MADVAAASDLGVAIPTCPGWTMRDLVRHTGGVHRWATGIVAGRRTRAWDADLPEIVGAWPDDRELVDWFRRGHHALVAVLEAAPDDVEWFTFLRGHSPLAMWARRQAHETAVHRVDAESPAGVFTPVSATFAADGIDELLAAFMTRGNRGLPIEEPRTLLVETTDTNDVWHVLIEPDRMHTSAAPAPADCTISGAAADLYLLLWNRSDAGAIDVGGDADVLTFWRNHVRVRWT